MKYARAVIGSNFGDEGKGKLVDHYAQHADLVVRHNSSAQAGHTVVTPDGRRHVFSHFGSGSFQGLPTFLGGKFLVHPILFSREMRDLSKLCTPRVIVDPECQIITPWDMELNRYFEEERGDKRHGSVGVGFGEAMERIEWSGGNSFHFTVSDAMKGRAYIRNELEELRRGWLPIRLGQYTNIPDRLHTFHENDAVMENFLDDIEDFLAMVDVQGWRDVAKAHDRVVFESAQGLMLSRRNRVWFPHLTRSDTGVFDVIDMLSRVGHYQLDATYVTRTYLTRHGAGPLPGEAPPALPGRGCHERSERVAGFVALRASRLAADIQLYPRRHAAAEYA